MFASDESLQVIREVVSAFERLGVPYAMGGSITSSLWGKPRFTADADVMVEPLPGKEAALCAGFGANYYISLSAVQEAVRNRSSFNIIHSPSGYKVDVFVRKDRPFEQSAFRRTTTQQLPDFPNQVLNVVSAEDIILFKLEWYRLGGETSERQWSDILGVMQVRADQLDYAYLEHWARELGVADLLARAQADAKLP